VPLCLVVSAAAAGIPRGAIFLQSLHGSLSSEGMPPCKRCSAARLHSRDDLLAMDDGDLTRMKDKLTSEVVDLEKELGELKTKNFAELGKLEKRLSDMNAAYEKFGKDSIASASKFSSDRAENAKKFEDSLGSTQSAADEMHKIHVELDELQTYLDPYVQKFIAGECTCSKAKALLQRLQASLHLSNVGATEHHSQVLLKTSGKIDSSADDEKYKLVRAVQQLEEKSSTLRKELQDGISDFSQQQRTTLDRIDATEKKSNLKATTENKYQDINTASEKALKASVGAAAHYSGLAETQSKRLQENKQEVFKTFKSFKAELQKCNCL